MRFGQSWLVDAKLQPDLATGRLLQRARLRDIVKRAEARLVLVHAPAGYGKSSAMAQWRAEAAHDNQRAAWLSLDDQDGDPHQFLCYLLAASMAAGCPVDYELPPHPQVLARSSLELLTNAVLRAISDAPAPDVIFLDDFHRAENARTSFIVRRLISDLPTTVLVLASRTTPSDIELAGLRGGGQVREVAQNDLRFTAAEVEEYLAPFVVSEDEREGCARLVERTEGWPIALQAIRQLVRGGEPVAKAMEQASGRSGVLSDYFLEQVFDRLSEEQQTLLLSTAMLERVNGDLADAICGTNTSWSLLDALENDDVFVQCIDAKREWYRYHRLFAEFIAERARRTAGLDPKRNAGQAATWFRNNGYHADSLQYALASDDQNLIAETLNAVGGWRHAMMGNLAGVENALGRLAQPILRSFPLVWVAHIYIQLKYGRLELAHGEFVELRRCCDVEIAKNNFLRNELGIMDCLISGYRDDQSRLLEQTDLLLSMETTAAHDDHILHAMRLNTLCVFHMRLAQLPKAVAAGEAAVRHYRKVGSLYGEIFIYFHHGYIFYLMGRLRDAAATLNQGLALAASHFGAESELYAIGAAFGALLAYEQNELAEADAHLAVALPIVEQCDAWTEVYFAAYGASLSLLMARGEWEDVERMRRRALRTAEVRQLPRLTAFVEAFCADRGCALGRDEWEFSTQKDVPPAAMANMGPAEIQVLCLHARGLIDAGRHHEAADRLDAYAKGAGELHMIRAAMTFNLLCAIACGAAGDLDEASVRLDDALNRAMFEGFQRPIIDEGAAVVSLIGELENLGSERRHNRLRDKFVSALVAEIQSGTDAQTRGSHILSAREQEVMLSVLRGRSNRETSEAIGISENTVKFHLKNVFQKLGVSSRDEAVRVALRDRLL